MDAYSGYNQIKMDHLDTPKMTFMSNHGNYYYNITPFGLKKTGVVYQRLIGIVISKKIGQNMEVYISGMIVKTSYIKSTTLTWNTSWGHSGGITCT